MTTHIGLTTAVSQPWHYAHFGQLNSVVGTVLCAAGRLTSLGTSLQFWQPKMTPLLPNVPTPYWEPLVHSCTEKEVTFLAGSESCYNTDKVVWSKKRAEVMSSDFWRQPTWRGAGGDKASPVSKSSYFIALFEDIKPLDFVVVWLILPGITEIDSVDPIWVPMRCSFQSK